MKGKCRTVYRMSAKDHKALLQNWAGVVEWVYNHTEACEEIDELRKLDRNAKRVGFLIRAMEITHEP